MDARIRFNNTEKLLMQMRKRGWTEQQILEALNEPGIPATGKLGPAVRHVHPITGKSLVLDAQTGEIFHLGGEGFRYA